MAYMNQEKKAVIQKALKDIIPTAWKWSLSVRHHSTLCLTIASADVDLLAEVKACSKRATERRGDHYTREEVTYIDINPHWYENQLDEHRELFGRIIAAMNTGNWNNSDAMTDYFDVGHYIDISIGRWNKPFVYTGAQL